MEDKKIVYVVIPNWNGEKFLKDCLESLSQQTEKHEVVVVENASTDNSLEILKPYKSVHVLNQAKNLGFAGGVNKGIRYALSNGASHILLLNNDALAHKDWIKSLLRTASENPNVGIVTPKMLKLDKETIDGCGDSYSRYGLAFPRGRDEKDTGQYNTSEEVFSGSGGASLYSAKMLLDVGLFDEDYFAYYEDVDISFRARLRGWQIKYCPSGIVYHYVSGSSVNRDDFIVKQLARNIPILFFKNMPQPYFWLYLPLFVYNYTRIGIFYTLRRNKLKPFFLGFIFSLGQSIKTIQKRRHIQSKIIITPAELNASLYPYRLPGRKA